MDTQSLPSAPHTNSEPHAGAPTPNVIVYSSPTCGFCHMAMEYLTEKGVPFIEKDVSTDRDALLYIMEKVGQAVTPIITVGDQVIVGFDRAKIDQALSAQSERTS